MDNYVLVERLGHGSFAIVWKARRKSDNRLVAVKQLRTAPATWEECKRLPEIRAAATVRHPHIISLLEAVRHGSELFLVFEYADSDLYRCLGPDRGRRFEEPQVRWVMRQLLSALAAVHGAGLVHCDVKPENLLLFARLGSCGEPVLKLCDLGQACGKGEVRAYVGTRWYRSPELLLGLEGAGCEIDLWAAGCFMAELLLLRPPFPGTDTRDMLFRICSALGAPEEGWHLSERLMQASGLRFAPCAAEGPLWFELSSTGASSSAVELVRALLRYDQNQRMPASRAMHAGFISGGAPEVPVTLSDERSRIRSVEGFQRSRDEAKAVERKIQAKSGARPAQGNSGFGFVGGGGLGIAGGLGVAGGVAPLGTTFGAPAQGQAAPFQTQPTPQPTPFLSSNAFTSMGVSVGVPNGPSVGSSAAAATELGMRRQHSEKSVFGLSNGPSAQAGVAELSAMRQQHSEKSGLLTMSAATRRAVQERRAYRREMAPSSSTGMMLPAPRASASTDTLGGLGLPSSSSNADFWEAPPAPPREQWTRVATSHSVGNLSASSPDISPKTPFRSRFSGGVLSDESGTEGPVGNDEDEELANLFWSQVEHSRASPAAGPEGNAAFSSTSSHHLHAGYVADAARAESGVHTVHVVSASSAGVNQSQAGDSGYQSGDRGGYQAHPGGHDARPRRRNRPGGGSSAGSRSSEAEAWEAQPIHRPAVVCAVAGSASHANVSGGGATGSASTDQPESLDPVDLLNALGESPPSGTGAGEANQGFFGAAGGPMARPAAFEEYSSQHHGHHFGHSSATGGYVGGGAARGIATLRGGPASVAPPRQASWASAKAPGAAFVQSGVI
mmetsp:Transcript_15137/g.26839  ORF Transcript_15137/g.26839 Transcript_15137/m.26839 type:complete len:841 (-) Transcript_15137:245-2767(-)